MLKNISPLLSPEMLKVLCEMGHGDRLVLADANFPAASIGKNSIVLRADGLCIIDLLDAILALFPLDTYVEHPVSLMQVVPGDDVNVSVWNEYKAVVSKYDDRGDMAFTEIERFAFYENARNAYAILATGDRALYANVILQKGVL